MNLWQKSVLGLLLVLCVCIGSRLWSWRTLTTTAIKNMQNNVVIIHPRSLRGREDIIRLPGNLLAWHEAIIYARTSGYLAKWYVDIGDEVKAGDLLAEIDTPELDAELRQAEADLNSIKARSTIAQITAKRWARLLKTASVSMQSQQEKQHTAEALAAGVQAAAAYVDKLTELVKFKHVMAPFDGVISYRGTDVGDLINVTNQTMSKPLFRVTQSHKLRLYIQVPQVYSRRMAQAKTVKFSLSQYPNVWFTASLRGSAHAIDTKTRTMTVEYIVQNSKKMLSPGSYSSVTIAIPMPQGLVGLPVNTLLFRRDGLQVATVDETHHVVLKAVNVAIDLGHEVVVDSGILPSEQLILNPLDSLETGDAVNILSSPR